MLGERYGWVPEKSAVPDSPEFDWVREYPAGASVTELEMHCAALVNPGAAQEMAFFFIRDNAFEKYVIHKCEYITKKARKEKKTPRCSFCS